MKSYKQGKASFVEGSRVGKEDAKIIGQAINEIEKNQGYVNREKFVEMARPTNSPLHKYFEWDDKKSADKYRLIQAGALIRWVQIELIDGKPSRAFVNVKLNDEQESRAYVNIETALNDESYRKQLLSEALYELDYWQNNYRMLRELSLIFVAMKKVKRKFKK